MDKLKKLKGAKTELQKEVQKILNDMVYDGYTIENILSDLFCSGCISGMINKLVWFNQTEAWFEKYKETINTMIANNIFETKLTISDMFKEFDAEDPLCLEQNNQNLLAWFSFEETARELADINKIEI